MKKRIGIFLFLYHSIILASAVTDDELKTIGQTLANYHMCSKLSLEMGDKAMLNYYSEMYDDSLLKAQDYQEGQLDIVIVEEKIGMAKLAKIDPENLGQFCLIRFDLLSRKMQEKKLAPK
ncbi:hypothetical protein [Psychromonas antarctica]|uniref:hypothetical protein n=1 Tax=Psychromonas antarctica TaxID=67573 RepID=UPI001EE7C397|nr:hypothetical protein [Psychromonas antarctica]MCG6199873.1 hypothetical protein [Psychromonas antarctica]